MQDTPFLSSKIVIKDLGVKDQSYWGNSRRFSIIFEDMDVDIPQCFLTTGIDDPMTGNKVVLDAMTQAEFSENLIFKPIP